MRYAPRCIAAVLLALTVIAGSAHAQKKYPIKLDRPREVGEAYRLATTVNARYTIAISANGSLMKELDSAYAMRFVADAKVIEMNKALNQPVITYTVKQCVKYEGGDTIQLIAPGTQLRYTRTLNGTDLRVVKGRVDESVMKKVSIAVTEVGRSGQKGLGTFTPKAVGEQWDIGGTMMLQGFLEQNGFVVKDGDIVAKAKLMEVSETGPAPSMKVKIDIDMKSFKLDIPELTMLQLKVSRSMGGATMVGSYPLDEAKGPSWASANITADFTASGTPSSDMPKIDVDMSFVLEMASEYSYK